MDPRRRDGLLALAALVALLAAGTSTVGWRPFLTPGPAALGVCGALAVETRFLCYPDRSLVLWERPGVAPAAAAAVVALGVVAATVAPSLVGALAWGLVTYLCLLACLLAGVGNPVARLLGVDGQE